MSLGEFEIARKKTTGEMIGDLHKCDVIVVDVSQVSPKIQINDVQHFRIQFNGFIFSFIGRILKVEKRREGDRIVIKKLKQSELH